MPAEMVANPCQSSGKAVNLGLVVGGIRARLFPGVAGDRHVLLARTPMTTHDGTPRRRDESLALLQQALHFAFDVRLFAVVVAKVDELHDA